MKRFTKIMLIASVVMLLAFVACSCGGNDGPSVCLHEQQTVLEAVAPTCTTAGLTAGAKCASCEVVLIAQQPIAALGHTETALAAKDATCTETGLTAGKQCSVCQTITVAQETVAAKGHTEEAIAAVAPTCTATGLTAGVKCSVCDEVITAQETVAATGHTEVTLEAVASTCTETGLTAGKKCSVCDTVTVSQETVPAKGHTEVEIPAVEKTCTTDGSTAGVKCSVCEEVIVAPTAIPASHEAEVVDAVAPDCVTTGLTEGSKCSVCGETLVAQEVVPELGHTPKAAVMENINAADCDSAGTYDSVVYCSVCDAELSRTPMSVEKMGHTFAREEATADYRQTLAPTCITKGREIAVCKDCGAEDDAYGRDINPTGEHAYTIFVETIAPDCLNDGYTTYKCSADANCVETENRDTVPALGHTYARAEATADYRQTLAPTCITNGREIAICKDCQAEDDAYGRDINPTGVHAYTIFVETIDPDCLNGGYTTYKCSADANCVETENRDPVAALGHTYARAEATANYRETLAPTCITKGREIAVCKDCQVEDDAYGRDVTPTGVHAYTIFVETIDPDCLNGGYTTYKCSADANCVETENRDLTDALGHTYARAEATADYRQTLAPTCITKGREIAICKDCQVEDDAYGRDINPTGVHAYTIFVETIDPDCLNDGYTTYKCSADANCVETENRDTVPALGHTYARAEATADYRETLAPTCITNGREIAICKDCQAEDDAYGRDVNPTGVHNLVAGTVVDPKCEVQGYTIYTCNADENCTETENRDFTDALEHNMVLDTDKLTNGAPSCLTNGDWAYKCTNGCGKVEYNLGGETNSGAVHGGYTDGEWVTGPTCITPATYYCTFCETNFPASLYPEIKGQATGAHTYDELIEASVASCTAYGYTYKACTNDENCDATIVTDWADKLDHKFGELDETTGTLICEDCGETFRNVTADVKQEEKRLCGEGCEGCAIHDMVVIVTSVKEPDADVVLPSGEAVVAPETEKTIALIALNGADDTVYTIVLKDAEDNVISTFDVTVGAHTNAFDIPTEVTGNAFVDISEVAGVVASIEVTASADASVAFYNVIK